MPAFQLILNGFGLAGLKPVIYRQTLNSENPTRTASNFPVQNGQSVGNLTGAAVDASPKSWLGTPVFADLSLPRGDGRADIELTTVLIEVSQRKNIVTTAVQGRNGTVKEYVSDGDYSIRIRGGLFTDGSDAYPSGAVRDLHEWLSRPEALRVVADYLRLFNIYTVVVTDFSFPQNEGFQNQQLFDITALSDTPEELIDDEN